MEAGFRPEGSEPARRCSKATNAAILERIDYGALQMRYRYGVGGTVQTLRAQPGTRFPHAWIEYQGQRLSTLDLFGSSLVSIGGPQAPGPSTTAGYRAGVDFRFVDEDVDWSSLTAREDAEVIMIRPDGFVAT